MKVIGTLMFIKQISYNFNKSTRTIVVQLLILSLMNYRIVIWSSTLETLLHNAKKLQHFATKVSVKCTMIYGHTYQKLKWLKIRKNDNLDCQWLLSGMVRQAPFSQRIYPKPHTHLEPEQTVVPEPSRYLDLNYEIYCLLVSSTVKACMLLHINLPHFF